MQRFTVILFGALLAMAGCHSDRPVIPIPPPAMTATGYNFFCPRKQASNPSACLGCENRGTFSGGIFQLGLFRERKILSAIKVPDQPGYVRSPYNPGRRHDRFARDAEQRGNLQKRTRETHRFSRGMSEGRSFSRRRKG